MRTRPLTLILAAAVLCTGAPPAAAGSGTIAYEPVGTAPAYCG